MKILEIDNTFIYLDVIASFKINHHLPRMPYCHVWFYMMGNGNQIIDINLVEDFCATEDEKQNLLVGFPHFNLHRDGTLYKVNQKPFHNVLDLTEHESKCYLKYLNIIDSRRSKNAQDRLEKITKTLQNLDREIEITKI